MRSRYWMYLGGGILLWTAFASDMGSDDRLVRVRAALGAPDSPCGQRADIWAQMITFTEVSALAVAVGSIVTIFMRQRAPE